MIGIIVTGHGNFATGLASSMKLIAGNVEKFEPVDFLENYSTDDLAAKINEAIVKLDTTDIIVFSDLAGGSPFKTSVEIKMFNPDKNIEVIAGTNLPMLIETTMARAFIEDLQMLTDMALNTGKDQVVKYTYIERVEETTEDGI